MKPGDPGRRCWLRLRGLAGAAARLGAQAAPKAGEPTPEGLQEGDSLDAMDLPLGVVPGRGAGPSGGCRRDRPSQRVGPRSAV